MAVAEDKEVQQEEPDFEIEGEEVELSVEDDTPEADRNRSPMPEDIVKSLENDELETYSDGVKERLKQMKKVWHDERRAKESALRENQQAVEMAKKAMEENKKLREDAKRGQEAYLDTAKKSVEYETEMAKRAYKDAYESGDTDSVVEAQSKLAEVNFKKQQLNSYRPSGQVEENSVNSTSTEAVKPQLDSKTMAWQERNTWYGSDEEMTAAALGFHQKLVRQKGDAYVGSDDYWADVDTTMRRRFPEYWDEQSTDRGGKPDRAENKPATVVAPASRSTSSKRIVLKQSQVSIAKRLGLTPEQYAKELRRMENQNG
tara:strand:- start:1070 stop:2017 length:948 start_codon:yes stop_codon:yes gene_type:complete